MHATRESWLSEAVEKLRSWFPEQGAEVPAKVVPLCGFVPGASPKKALGCAHDPVWAKDSKTWHVFISPVLDDTVRVLDVLLHELIHCAVGIDEGHKGEFRRVAKAFGLAGKMTATYAEEGSELYERLAEVSKELGTYPHNSMQVPERGKRAKSNGWLRYKSLNEESYKVVVSPKSVEEFGPPCDPWGEQMAPAK